jgi:hypothetical protein
MTVSKGCNLSCVPEYRSVVAYYFGKQTDWGDAHYAAATLAIVLRYRGLAPCFGVAECT